MAKRTSIGIDHLIDGEDALRLFDAALAANASVTLFADPNGVAELALRLFAKRRGLRVSEHRHESGGLRPWFNLEVTFHGSVDGYRHDITLINSRDAEAPAIETPTDDHIKAVEEMCLGIYCAFAEASV